MDSYVYGWRAMVWGRVWIAVLVLTLAWSVGVGLALRALTPTVNARGDCRPTALQPLLATPADWLRLPLNAMVAAPYGLYVSGLQFALGAYVIVLIPGAFLPHGKARRVLGAPILLVVATAVVATAWNFELDEVRTSGTLPTLVCSN